MKLISTKKEFRKTKLIDLINLCLENELEYIQNVLKDWLKNNIVTLDDYRERLIDISSLCEGTVYREDKTYRLAGFILKRERKIKNKKVLEYLFLPVYYEGNVNLVEDPLIFQNCCTIYNDHGFISDVFGNIMHLDSVIEEKETVDNCITKRNIDLNQRIKSQGIYLDSEDISNK